jgi:hypothetical protein
VIRPVSDLAHDIETVFFLQIYRLLDARGIMRLRAAGRARWREGLLLIGCTTALVGSPVSLAAQVVQLRPLANVSFPTRFSIKSGEIQVRQKVSFAVGARMTVTFNDRFDVVSTVSYSPGSATLLGAGKRIELASSAHSLGVSTGARYWLLPPPRTFSWEIHSGIGLVFGGQPVYQDLLESSTLSGVIGTTLRYQIGQIVILKLKVQERLYRVHFGSPERGSSRRPFQVSFGLSFPFLESLR